ncbi:MAG: MBL fold metallo-hydrolase [Spirochaetales bacterium]|jgi:hydroxyacylglutathione hydrolase|nr:MBL fold metallo-hydrolase [Spirochaetales bacterium]
MVEHIIHGVHKVGGGSWFGAVPVCSDEGDCNVYLIEAGDRLLLIDSGRLAGIDAIRGNIVEAGFTPEQVTDLLLTHSHFDHSDTTAKWQAEHGLTVHMSSIGAEYLRVGDHRLVGYHIVDGFSFQPFQVDHSINPESQFTVGSLQLKAHVCPGHTPDSMVFAFEISGMQVWVCGDITFGRNHKGQLGHIGLQNMLWKSNLRNYEDSLVRMLGMEIPEVLLPGHGAAVIGVKEVTEVITASLDTVREMLGFKHLVHFDISNLIEGGIL